MSMASAFHSSKMAPGPFFASMDSIILCWRARPSSHARVTPAASKMGMRGRDGAGAAAAAFRTAADAAVAITKRMDRFLSGGLGGELVALGDGRQQLARVLLARVA